MLVPILSATCLPREASQGSQGSQGLYPLLVTGTSTPASPVNHTTTNTHQTAVAHWAKKGLRATNPVSRLDYIWPDAPRRSLGAPAIMPRPDPSYAHTV